MPQSPDLTLPLAQPITLTLGPGSHLVTLMDAAILIRDLEPFRQARPVVAIRSQTNRTTFRNLVDALDNSQGYSRMFFVYHTPAEPFENTAADRVTVWHRYEIARQAVRAGLINWILSRTT